LFLLLFLDQIFSPNQKSGYYNQNGHSNGMTIDEKRFHWIFLFCQSVCQQKWSPNTLKIFQTIINSGLVGKNQLMYQMIQEKLKSNGLDLSSLDSTEISETDLKGLFLFLERHIFNELFLSVFK
jgi:hypothetical protein